MHGIPRVPGRRAYSSVGREVGAVCGEHLAVSAVSILELVTNSDSSRMSRAPNLHSLRATKLFIYR